jgi:hypothetical protein
VLCHRCAQHACALQVSIPANGAPYGSADVVEVLGIVKGDKELAEMSHVDYVQADQGTTFSAHSQPFDTLQACPQ